MALPVFVAASSKAPAAQDATPALPAGMSSGNIVLLFATCPTANTISITAAGSIATWTPISGSPVTVTGGEALYVWWGRWASGTTGPTVHASASDVIIAATAAWSGCIDTGDPVDIANTGSETTVDNSFSFASGVSSTRNNTMAICVASILRDSNTASVPVMTNASLGSLASRLNICTNTGAGSGFGVSEGTKATAGTLGTWACTYAATSAKSYLTLALIGGISGVVTPTAETVTQNVVGVRTRLGAVATALVVAQAVVGARQTFAVVTPTVETVTQSVIGTTFKTGAAATVLTLNQSVQGVRETFSVVTPTAETVAQSINGVRTTFSVVDPTAEVVTQSVVGVRTRFGVLDPTNEIVTQSVIGLHTGVGAVTTNLVIAQALAGVRQTFAVVTPSAEVIAQAVAGVRETFAVVTPSAETFTQVIAGVRQTFSVVTPTVETITQFVDGNVEGGGEEIFGIVTQSLVIHLTAGDLPTSPRRVISMTAAALRNIRIHKQRPGP
jgi:hypothetical protein